MDNSFYVYTLSYPTDGEFDGSVFFVGKGKGDQIHKHESKGNLVHNTPKNVAIRAVLAAGLRIKKTKIAVDLEAKDATEIRDVVIKEHLSSGTALTNMPMDGRGGKRKDRGAVLGALPKHVLEAGRLDTDKHLQTIIRFLMTLPDDYEPWLTLPDVSLDELLELDRDLDFLSIW
jgi:hypothetical protein